MLEKGKENRLEELLEMLLIFQLRALGAPIDRIAKIVGKRKAVVIALLKGVPAGGRSGV